MSSYKKCLASLLGLCLLPIVSFGANPATSLETSNPAVSNIINLAHNDCRTKVKRCTIRRECAQWGHSRCFNCNRPQTHQSKTVCGFSEKQRAESRGYYCSQNGGGCKRWEERRDCKWVCQGRHY